jgi:hypothetical protein
MEKVKTNRRRKYKWPLEWKRGRSVTALVFYWKNLFEIGEFCTCTQFLYHIQIINVNPQRIYSESVACCGVVSPAVERENESQ